MKAGKLRHLIDIEYRSGDVPDGFGNTLQSWEKLYQDVPAEFKSTPSAETFTAGEVQSQAAFIIATRFLPGIDSSNRILFSGRYFNILGVDNIQELGRELQFQVKEIVAPQANSTAKSLLGKAAIV